MDTPSLILDTDSYKFSHWKQYPPGTEAMYSYFESRGGKFDSTLFFGLQYYLKKYLSKPITFSEVVAASNFAKKHGVPFNEEGWNHIVDKYDGFIPVLIKAVPEGTIVPTSNILMSVECHDPKCFWVVSWLETMLVRLWYPITVATTSYECKKIIREALELSSDDPEAELPFKLHDFGSRGVSSQESAMIGGAAHLVNFMGSDTVAGIWMANEYYHHEMSGISIPAAEHSTMTMWGKDRESDAYRNMLEQYKDQPLMAVVSDSYDIYNAATEIWGTELRAEVEAYEGTLVIRPDSGDPATVCVKLLGLLAIKFGCTTNSKGYAVIDNDVRILQGDGINIDSLKDILKAVTDAGFSATNIAFGMGGGLLQQCNRDTQKFAFKCSWALVNGKAVEVFKEPVTDSGKTSKKGRLELAGIGSDEVVTVKQGSCAQPLLEIVYHKDHNENKPFFKEDPTLQEIRDRSARPKTQYKGWLDHGR